MTVIRSSAPGKAVISGEYAVLGNAPALSMALNRRAKVSVTDGETAEHSLRAPGYLDGPLSFRVAGDGQFEWQDPLPSADAFALFEAVWRRVGVGNARGLSIVLDTREFADADSGLKLGIGSSAALAVALSAVLRALPGVEEAPEQTVASCALDAHREFQNGKGSGVDIATAVEGGLIAFRRNGRSEALGFPSGLVYQFFWSGQSAATASKIDGLSVVDERAVDRDLLAAADAMPALTAAGNATEFLGGLRAFVRALSNYDGEHGLGIFAAGHQALVDFAHTCQELVYKPCGAGGGDIGVAIATSVAALQAFAERATAVGFRPLDARLETRGVLLEAG